MWYSGMSSEAKQQTNAESNEQIKKHHPQKICFSYFFYYLQFKKITSYLRGPSCRK